MSLPPELAEIFGETSNVFRRARIISREMIAENTLALAIGNGVRHHAVGREKLKYTVSNGGLAGYL